MLEDKLNNLTRGLVLFIDDDRNMLEMLSRRAKHEGFFAVKASNSDEAVRQYGRTKPDAVVVDLKIDGDPKGGLKILQDLNSIDPLITSLILTGRASYGAVKDSFGLASAYIVKPVGDEFWERLRTAISSTEERRKDVAGRIASLILHKGALNRDTAPMRVDEYHGSAFKAILDTFPYRDSAFTLDSALGAASLRHIALEMPYPESAKAFLFKRYSSSAELAIQIDNQSRSAHAGIKHPGFIYFWADKGDNTYVMHPVIFGPNYAHIFSILNSAIHAVKSSPAKKEEAAQAKDALIKVSLDSSVRWYSIGSNDWCDVSKCLLETKEFNKILERRLYDMRTRYKAAFKNALHRLSRISRKKIGLREIRKVLECVGDFPAITPYSNLQDNTAFSSVLLDYSPQNVGIELGVLRPTPESFFKIMEKIKQEEGGLPAALSKRYAIFDTSPRTGHVFEDFIHFIHSPEAGLSIKERLDYFKYFVNNYSSQIGPESSDSYALWMAYAMMGIYKAPRKSTRYLEQYIPNSMDDFARFTISRQELKARRAEYFRKTKHWVNEAKWFAALAHLLSEQQKEASTFDSLERIVGDNLAVEEDAQRYQKALLRHGSAMDPMKLTDRMIYLHNFLQHYFSDMRI